MASTSSLTPGQKYSLLREACLKGEKLLEPEFVLKQYYKVWNEETLEQLKSAFGETSSVVKDFEESKHILPKPREIDKFYKCPDGHLFFSLISICPECGKRGRHADSTRPILMKQLQVLNAMGFMLRPSTALLNFFDEFDPDIQRVSRQLFHDGHHAEAVTAALKELNKQVKDEYKKRKQQAPDGKALMESAFSEKNPVFPLADLTTESGRNIQLGFMRLFSGSIIGIRNPHSHENLSLDLAGAKHFLYFADLLMKKFKDAVRRDS